MLTLRFVWVGKTDEREYARGIERYLTRIRRWARVEEIVVRPEKIRSDEAARREGERILRAAGERTAIVALDSGGKMKTSEELSRMLVGRRDRDPRPVALVVGGASGLSPEILSRAEEVLSLSRMTFPHQIARLVLVEQVYRALSIDAGMRYH